MSTGDGATFPDPVRLPRAASAPEAGDVDAAAQFQVQLPVFEGPLQLLLHLVESRQLDLLAVPLSEVADAFVAHIAMHPVDVRNLADFVATAAQLILLKSRRMLREEPQPLADAGEELDEDDLRRRLIDYRRFRDVAAQLGERDLAQPAFRREPREADLPVLAAPRLDPILLSSAIATVTQIAEPEAPPPAVMAREVTIAEQVRALRSALGRTGTVVLQAVLAACRTRTEATVTFMALLELVRRREVRVEQRTMFGPILLERMGEGQA